ncbi:MAG: hypothetical protein RL186_1712, partial [Pseudomonadota bacterium]
RRRGGDRAGGEDRRERESEGEQPDATVHNGRSGRACYFTVAGKSRTGPKRPDSIGARSFHGLLPSVFHARCSPATVPGTPTEASKEGAQDGPANQNAAADAAEDTGQRETAEFQQAELSLRQALQNMPELAELSRNIIVDQTPEGLRIQLVDQEGRPMFNPGSAQPNDRARIILQAVAQIVQSLPNRLVISGHTDAAPNPDTNQSNWELSAARANASLRVIKSAGLSDDRIAQVSGKAGADPLFPDDPFQAANRRISIVLQRTSAPLPADAGL